MEYWVAPCLTDGLGNRLFQLACAKAYSEKYKKKLVFLLAKCGKTGHGKFENIFNLFPDIPILEYATSWTELVEKPNRHYVYQELSNASGNILTCGYRQCYNYFSNTTLKPNFDNCITKERLDYLQKKYMKPNLFFIHIRLGDFLLLPHHQINIQKYYSNALSKIPPNTTPLVFTDDIEGMKRFFVLPYDICEETDEIETLYLMSLCMGGICANSTFSYWGAYFAKQNNPEFIGYYPNSLGQGLPYPQDYYPPWSIKLEA